MDLLVQAGANIEADEIGCYGGKPLHWAAEHAPGAAELLLKRGAKVDSRNVKKGKFLGSTPLIMNARQKEDCDAVTSLLLRFGADRNAVDSEGFNALARSESLELVKIPALLKSDKSI